MSRPSSFPDRLKLLRGIAEISASELARLANMQRTHVSLIERSEAAGVQARTLAELSRVLGVTLDWLYLGKGEAPSGAVVRAAVAKAIREKRKSSSTSAAA